MEFVAMEGADGEERSWPGLANRADPISFDIRGLGLDRGLIGVWRLHGDVDSFCCLGECGIGLELPATGCLIGSGEWRYLLEGLDGSVARAARVGCGDFARLAPICVPERTGRVGCVPVEVLSKADLF